MVARFYETRFIVRDCALRAYPFESCALTRTPLAYLLAYLASKIPQSYPHLFFGNLVV